MRLRKNNLLQGFVCVICVLVCAGTAHVGTAQAQSSRNSGEQGDGLGTVIKPLGSGEPIDYYNSERIAGGQVVQNNLIEEQTPIPAGVCFQRVVPPNSTTVIPFIFDGQRTAINIAPGKGVTRLFISAIAGYDPVNRLAPGPHNDYASPCHLQTNLPATCDKDGKNCKPNRYNQSAVQLMDVNEAMAAPEIYPECVLVTDQTYFLNIQNQTKTGLCASLGMGLECGACE